MDHPADEFNKDLEAIQSAILRVSWASQRRLGNALDLFGLTLPQYMALRAIDRSQEKSLSMSDLAQDCFQVLPTVSGIVVRLEERGLLERRRDPLDRRSWRVLLTDGGKRLLTTIDQQNEQRLHQILLGFSVEERRAMLSAMRRYLDAILSETQHTREKLSVSTAET